MVRRSTSVGTALYPEDGTTSDSLPSAAEAAMYAAKNNTSTNEPRRDGETRVNSIPEEMR